MDPVVLELAEEMRREHPPVEGSIALLEWTCRHGKTFPDWYVKEVMHELGLCDG